jgi:uncharacterized protein YyaL (SSP411 family)
MNLLGNETSPYLRQHKNNPVHWMPWGTEAFAKAKAEGKPVLLSVGYAACHWCHVMAHESFEDPATADVMNSLFINIKVDREERPDIDSVYQSALALMGGQGGWPLTMFLTPDAEAFWGGTYFPQYPRHGLPGFREVLRGVAESYTTEKEKVSHNTKTMTEALKKLQDGQAGQMVLPERIGEIGGFLMRLIDPVHGGFASGQGGAPKFPNLHAHALLWDCYLRTGEDHYKAATLLSLIRMCQGGIYDHVDGGFARYTVDAEWLIPHFEKMLYDNAQFIDLLSEVYRETQHPLFAARVRETIDWAVRGLGIEKDGLTGFASSFDADSDDGSGHVAEGAYYIWKAGDIDVALGSDAAFYREAMDITVYGNWHERPGYSIPNRLANPAWRGEEEEAKLGALHRKVRFHRQQRTAPARDDKVLADWNGLMIAALVKAAFVFNEQSWRDMATAAYRFVRTHMMDAKTQVLHHVWCDGRAAHPATLDDYAAMILAALSLFEQTGDVDYLNDASNWRHILEAEYADDVRGGFYMTAKGADDLPLRPQTADDTAVPAGNGMMVSVYYRIAQLTGDQSARDRAEKTARAYSAINSGHFFSRATLLRHSLAVATPLSLYIAAADGGADDFIYNLRHVSAPHLVRIPATHATDLPKTHPVFGKTTQGGMSTAYLCPGQSCLPPTTSAEALKDMIKAVRGGRHRPPANDG